MPTAWRRLESWCRHPRMRPPRLAALGVVGAVTLACLPAAALARTLGEEHWSVGRPLPVRNLAPVTWLYGLPRPTGPMLAAGVTAVSLTVEHSNNFAGAAAGDVRVIFDGSTTVLSPTVRRSVGARWEWCVQVPMVFQSGGFTDAFIEHYHDLFGFPQQHRDEVPRNRLLYRIESGGDTPVNVTRDSRHVGDVRGWIGYRLVDSPGRQAVLRAMVELPTGRMKDLSGSGTTDTAAWVELADSRWLRAAGVTVTLMGGLAAPGQGDLLAGRQRRVVFSGHLGLHRPLGRRVVLRAQLDANSDVFHSSLAPLGRGAILGTLGGSVALSRAVQLDLGVIEDLTTQRAPDVTFLLSLGTRFR